MSKKISSSFNPNPKRGGIYRKLAHPQSKEEGQGWEEADICDTLNIFDYTENRTPVLIVEVTNGNE